MYQALGDGDGHLPVLRQMQGLFLDLLRVF